MMQKGFYKILLMFIVAISIPAISIGYLAIRNSTTHIIRQADMSSNVLLAEKKLYIERQMSEIDNLTNQIMASDIVWRLFEPNGSYAARLDAMSEVLLFINKIAGSNKSIASIYLINRAENYVLWDAKYALNDFYDSGIRELVSQERFTVLPPRKVPSLLLSDRTLVSCIRSFKDVNSDVSMDIVINIDYDGFVGSLNTPDNPKPLNLLIFNDSDQLILNNTGIDQVPMQEQLPFIRGSDNSSIRQTLDNTDYFMSKTHSDFLGWTIVYSQPFEQVVDSAKLLRQVLVYSIVIVLMLAFAMAYLFSVFLYRPLARLVADIRRRMIPTNGKGKDEYSLIGGAVNALFQENRTLQSQFGLAFPYVKQYSVFELLSGKVWNDEKFQSVIQLLGKSFDKPRFAVGVLDYENTELTDPSIEAIESFFEKRLQTILLSVMNERRLVLIVNTELEKADVYAMFGELKELLNAGGLEITLSVSSIFSSLNRLFLAYQEALQLLHHKFFIGKNEMIVRESVQVAESNGKFYEKRLEEKLLDSIRSQNTEKAIEAVSDLTHMLAGQAYSTGYVKYAIFQICSNLIGALSEMGGRLEEAGIDGSSLWESIQQADTMTDLERLLRRFIESGMNVTAALKQKQHTEIVGKTMEFIQRSYRQNLSIKEISTNVYLSPGYLSTIFKTETGLTLYDYITQIRMEEAAKLILNSEGKIQDVAQAVGYNNTQSFIRFFKKTYKMTPLEYRRKLSLLDS